MNPVQELHKSKEYCLSEMQRIREMWSNKNTFTEKNINGARQSLAMILLYCPSELSTHTEAMLNELMRREMYLTLKV